ncbi:hypothetical protein MGG_16742 [Pyricularia oryzae 70-15]|uniref:Uncharacterized protein n=4 Tax=Pyricularia oryzae TaxID=318829 RepID=G4N4W4_PYRO7|nr:uncharacterized protein MGG_16742 [Pyricularia oryzae 70-15]ELQ39960.1 hypothetical protein OOU_Y34scaffold00464g42 [Pyricularia oryzae Y34]KAI7925894.1 hypothetical protein M0657_004004 [Pyricularia oryzae]EHA52076.1 hypothetical protein MGG_16742 [Pyricularia oryzae 70-15]KAI7928471.1 hypothetical protein M9X92_001857 [Pyricularia oryzae]QBZ58748.1 hypothetical protein PoMZ_03706 [Pyricularia oryzae]
MTPDAIAVATVSQNVADQRTRQCVRGIWALQPSRQPLELKIGLQFLLSFKGTEYGQFGYQPGETDSTTFLGIISKAAEFITISPPLVMQVECSSNLDKEKQEMERLG